MGSGTAPVRAATRADAAEIVRLGALMYVSMGIPPTPEWEARNVAAIERRLGDDLNAFVIDGEADGQLASSALINICPRLARPGIEADEHAYIQWVSTDPAYQRRGYARALMEAVMDECAARGIPVVELHASTYGEPLYRELGFISDRSDVSLFMRATRTPG